MTTDTITLLQTMEQGAQLYTCVYSGQTKGYTFKSMDPDLKSGVCCLVHTNGHYQVVRVCENVTDMFELADHVEYKWMIPLTSAVELLQEYIDVDNRARARLRKAKALAEAKSALAINPDDLALLPGARGLKLGIKNQPTVSREVLTETTQDLDWADAATDAETLEEFDE